MTNVLWYVIALCLMGVSIVLCLSASWQTDGVVQAIYGSDGSIVGTREVVAANNFQIAPRTTSVLWAILIYGALIARRYVRNFSNPATLVLVAANIFFMASLIESFLPAQEVPLFGIFGYGAIKINPQTVLLFAAALSWLGMRALSGVSIVLFGIAFLSRATELNLSLGLYGSFYVLCGFLSLMIQARLPYMIPEGGWSAALLQDFGAIQIAAKENVAALADKAPSPERAAVS